MQKLTLRVSLSLVSTVARHSGQEMLYTFTKTDNIGFEEKIDHNTLIITQEINFQIQEFIKKSQDQKSKGTEYFMFQVQKFFVQTQISLPSYIILRWRNSLQSHLSVFHRHKRIRTSGQVTLSAFISLVFTKDIFVNIYLQMFSKLVSITLRHPSRGS